MAQVGSGGGYSVQPVIEVMTGLGSSSLYVAGSAANTGNNVYIWILWVKDDAIVGVS